MKSSPRCHRATTASPTITAKAAKTRARSRQTASLKSPVPERRSCRTSGTHGARRTHRLSPRRLVRGVLSRRASLSSVGRTPKPCPRYPPRPRTCSPSSLVATGPNRGDRSAVKACESSSISKQLGGWASHTSRGVTCPTQQELALQVESCSPRLLRLARPLGRVGRLRAFGRGPGRRASYDTLAHLSRPVKTSTRSQPLAELRGESGREASRRRFSPLFASVRPPLEGRSD